MFINGKKALAIFWIICVSYEVTGCTNHSTRESNRGKDVPKKSIALVLEENTERLMAIAGVVGTGEGLCNNKPCIKIFVIKKTPELQKKIPRTLEGYPVEFEETGDVRALPK